MRTRLTVEGIADAGAEFTAMGKRARRPEPALRAQATRRDLQAAAGRRFRRGLRRDTPETILRKRRRGLSTRTLVATGAAEAAIVHNREPAASSVTFQAWDAELRWGLRGRNALYYMVVHARGYTSGGRRVPARRVIVVDRPARESVAGRVVRYVSEASLS